MDRIPPNPHATFIAEVAKRDWNFLQSNERLVLTNHPWLHVEGQIKECQGQTREHKI